MALLKFRRSATPSKVPTTFDLELGELAMNTFDGKIFMKKDNGTQSIVEIGGGGSGIISAGTFALDDGSSSNSGIFSFDDGAA